MTTPYKVIENKRKNILLILAQTVLLSALICSLPSRSAFSISDTNNPYVFVPGDKLLVTVFGHEDLSGEYTVDDHGYLQLPIGDPVRIGGTTLKESQRRLTSGLQSNDSLRNPQVSVRIAELRPVYIIGAVKTPGSFPFRFGMTVADVIALAGGFGNGDTATTSSQRSQSEFFAATERLATLKRNRLDLRILLARMDAELTENSVMVLPESIKLDQDPATQFMIKQQEAALLSSRRQHQQTLDLIRKQMPRVEAEIEALKKERTAAKRRSKLATDYAKIYENLRKKGLARAETVFNTQTAIALHEGTIAQIDARLSNLAQRKGTLAIELQKIVNNRINQINVEKQRVVIELNRIETSLPFVESLIALNRNGFGTSIFTDQDNLPYKIFVSRRIKPRNNRTEVDLYHRIFPGDFIDVRVVLRRQVPDS